jgi:mRNA interferase MazF
MYQKDHDTWNQLKKKLDVECATPFFNEGEIWWGSLGVNIGHEEDGKSTKFNRPVLVIRKFNKRLFWGLPVTTKIKENPHYYQFVFKNTAQCAMLTQMRLWDAGRLTDKMGRIEKGNFREIKNALIAYLK